MRKFNLDDICFFDTETTGVPAKGLKWDLDAQNFPDIVSIAWSIGDVEKYYIVKPNGWVIPQEATDIHGITTEIAIEKGIDFEIVMSEFLEDCDRGMLVCAHNIYFDTSMVKANVVKYLGMSYLLENAERPLHKSKRIDTMMKTIKFVGALYQNGRPGKFPTLEELYCKLFPGETFSAHNALEDVRALKKCVPKLVELGIIELVQKEYPAEQLKLEPQQEKKTEIELSDPSPIELVPIVGNYENHLKNDLLDIDNNDF